MGSFYFYNQNPSGFCFLVQIRAFSNSKLTGIIKFNNERENEMNSALSSKKKSSCKWPIMKKMHSPLFRWVGVSGNIQGSGCLPFSKGSRKYSWKANGTRLFESFRQKKISGGNGTSEKLVVFFRTECLKRIEIRVPFLQTHLSH